MTAPYAIIVSPEVSESLFRLLLEVCAQAGHPWHKMIMGGKKRPIAAVRGAFGLLVQQRFRMKKAGVMWLVPVTPFECAEECKTVSTPALATLFGGDHSSWSLAMRTKGARDLAERVLNPTQKIASVS